MSSHNPSGAVDQQERPGFEQWVVGFVDGEGCFSISVVRNAGCRLGWQVQHEFAVTQAAPSRPALEALGRFFQCGRIIESNRHDNHRAPLLRYSVKSRRDLVERVIPFFEMNPLVTAKQSDFKSFCVVLTMMQAGGHLSQEGMTTIVRITETMNCRKRSRFLESSEAIRQPAHTDT
jgi:LAGLIDADG endonuclease